MHPGACHRKTRHVTTFEKLHSSLSLDPFLHTTDDERMTYGSRAAVCISLKYSFRAAGAGCIELNSHQRDFVVEKALAIDRGQNGLRRC
jgi:hypothetical protein